MLSFDFQSCWPETLLLFFGCKQLVRLLPQT